MLKRIVAVLIGVTVAMAIIFGNEFVDAKLYPAPAALDWHDEAAVNAFMASLPTGALLIVLLGWILATFVGACIAYRISKQGRVRAVVMIVLILLSGAAINMALFAHPVWFWIVTLASIPGAAWLAVRMSSRT